MNTNQNFRLSVELLGQIDEAAAAAGVPRTTWIRQVLDERINGPIDRCKHPEVYVYHVYGRRYVCNRCVRMFERRKRRG